MARTVPFFTSEESFVTELIIGHFYSFTEGLLQFQAEQSHCLKICKVRTSETTLD